MTRATEPTFCGPWGWQRTNATFPSAACDSRTSSRQGGGSGEESGEAEAAAAAAGRARAAEDERRASVEASRGAAAVVDDEGIDVGPPREERGHRAAPPRALPRALPRGARRGDANARASETPATIPARAHIEGVGARVEVGGGTAAERATGAPPPRVVFGRADDPIISRRALEE